MTVLIVAVVVTATHHRSFSITLGIKLFEKLSVKPKSLFKRPPTKLHYTSMFWRPVATMIRYRRPSGIKQQKYSVMAQEH